MILGWITETFVILLVIRRGFCIVFFDLQKAMQRKFLIIPSRFFYPESKNRKDSSLLDNRNDSCFFYWFQCQYCFLNLKIVPSLAEKISSRTGVIYIPGNLNFGWFTVAKIMELENGTGLYTCSIYSPVVGSHWLKSNPIYQPLRSGRIWHKVNF